MIKKTIYFLVSIFLAATSAYSQDFSDTLYCEVGIEAAKSIKFTDNTPSGQRNLAGEIVISNPTVFFVDSMKLTSLSNTEVFAKFTRLHDTLYTFTIEDSSLSCIYCNYFVLYGTPLAGNDSVCKLRFQNLVFNGNNLPPITILIKSDPLTTPLPYLKNVKFFDNYPNPAIGTNEIFWRYRIDRASEIIFNLWNVEGCLLSQYHDLKLEQGFYTYTLQLDPELASGAYYFEIITNTGRDVKKFIIAR